MRVIHLWSAPIPVAILYFAIQPATGQTGLNETFARDSQQPIDQAYTDHIRKYTTDPQFSSHLVDYLPASPTVPAPSKVLGDVVRVAVC